jgi:hypothetical protein
VYAACDGVGWGSGGTHGFVVLVLAGVTVVLAGVVVVVAGAVGAVVVAAVDVVVAGAVVVVVVGAVAVGAGVVGVGRVVGDVVPGTVDEGRVVPPLASGAPPPQAPASAARAASAGRVSVFIASNLR